jgi:hypothetical protein
MSALRAGLNGQARRYFSPPSSAAVTVWRISVLRRVWHGCVTRGRNRSP